MQELKRSEIYSVKNFDLSLMQEELTN